MRQLFNASIAVLTLTGASIFSSCQKTSTSSPLTSFTPLQAFINSDTTLSVFYAAIQKTGDNSLYKGIDSITVLMPTNAAFASQGITASTINSMPAASVDSLLRYHYIAGASDLTTGSYNSYTSLLGPTVYGYGNTDGSNNYFNGSIAILQILGGSNATVYKLNSPLQIPSASMMALLNTDTSLAYFKEAVSHTGISLAPVSGWNTILVPTNAAFIAAGYTTPASIDSADAGTLTNILQYHILPGQYFTNNFIGLGTVGSSEGNVINLTFSNGIAQFTGTGNITAAGITILNRVAGTNTVVQTINGLLTP